MNREKAFSFHLAAISLLGMAFAFIVTFRFGAGLATDGARYLSTAENLINGRGFIEYLGVPLTQFPPVYSIIIAGIGWITRADVFYVAQYLNILTFGLTIWLAGIFFRDFSRITFCTHKSAAQYLPRRSRCSALHRTSSRT